MKPQFFATQLSSLTSPTLRWLVVCMLLALQITGKASAVQKIVVIDAGHGGKDPGTVVGNAKEKNVVLDIALKVGNMVKQKNGNIRVVYTRNDDRFIDLIERAKIANKINADLFVSIHANYCGSPEINGTETYVLGLHRTEDNLNVAKKENSVILMEDDYTTRYEGFNPNLSESYIMFELLQDAFLEQSLTLASIIQSNFKVQAQRHDRDVRQAGFLVLRETAMPSVLIETGYLSNKKENSYLLTDKGRSEIAESISKSLLTYLERLESKDHGTPTEDRKRLPLKEDTDKTVSQTKPGNTEKTVVANKRQEVQKVEPNRIPVTENKNNNKIIKSTDSSGTLYAIQIGVFSKRIDLNSKVFKGVSQVIERNIDGKYKYYCAVNPSFDETRSNFDRVIRLFPDAFIVILKDNYSKMYGDGHGNR